LAEGVESDLKSDDGTRLPAFVGGRTIGSDIPEAHGRFDRTQEGKRFPFCVILIFIVPPKMILCHIEPSAVEDNQSPDLGAEPTGSSSP
jgi:hypothetical protein